MSYAKGEAAREPAAERSFHWRSPRGSIEILVLIALCAWVGFEAQALHWKLDDAFISFAYARNWASGEGVVFNPGERVEGYTSFLWVLLMALVLRAGGDPVSASSIVGSLCAVGCVAVAWSLSRTLLEPRFRPLALLSALIVAGHPALAMWAASGMETLLFSLFFSLALFGHVARGSASIAAPVWLGLASLTRPEAWLTSCLLVAGAWITGPRTQAFRYSAILISIVLPWYTWRFAYYGHPVPNTFYAKVGGFALALGPGALYLASFLRAGGALLALGAAMTMIRPSLRRRVAAVVVAVLAYTIGVVAVGGDAFSHHRMFMPLLPVLAALSVSGATEVASSVLGWKPRQVAGIVALSAAVACAPYYGGYQTRASYVAALADLNRMAAGVSRQISQQAMSTDSVAGVGTGVLKYQTRLRVIDMVGLTDEHIAHRHIPDLGKALHGHGKYDSDYVLGQNPAFILLGSPENSALVPALTDMANNPVFRQRYVSSDGLAYLRRDRYWTTRKLPWRNRFR